MFLDYIMSSVLTTYEFYMTETPQHNLIQELGFAVIKN